MSDDKKVKADDYGDIVVKSLNSLRQKNELCDFKVSAGGHVFDVSLFYGCTIIICGFFFFNTSLSSTLFL